MRYLSPAWHMQDHIYDALANAVALIVQHGIDINARTLNR